MRPIVKAVVLALVFFSITFTSTAQVTDDCFPKCRKKFLCHNGSCISKCNPPCPDYQTCNDSGECDVLSAKVNVDTVINSQPDNIKTNPVFSKFSKYFGATAGTTSEVVFVYNDFSGDIPFEIETKDADEVNELILEKLEETFKSISIVDGNTIEKIHSFNGIVVTSTVDKYYTKNTDKGQRLGYLTMTLNMYDVNNPKFSIESTTVAGDGGSDTWRDIKIFMRAVDKVAEIASDNLKKSLKKKKILSSYLK